MSRTVLLMVVSLATVAFVAVQPAARAAARNPALTCRMFAVPLEDGAEVTTTDTTTPLGMWADNKIRAGWTVERVDFEIGQKATGFPQGWVQLCLRAP